MSCIRRFWRNCEFPGVPMQIWALRQCCAKLHRQGRGFFQRRLGFTRWLCDFVTSTGRHVKIHITQHVESGIKALVGFALVQQVDNKRRSLIDQLCLQVVSFSFDNLGVFAGKIDLFQFSIDLGESISDPFVEPLSLYSHTISPDLILFIYQCQ